MPCGRGWGCWNMARSGLGGPLVRYWAALRRAPGDRAQGRVCGHSLTPPWKTELMGRDPELEAAL